MGVAWERFDLRELVDPGPYDDDRPVKVNCIVPTHDDDTASLALYRDQAHCFGCGKHWHTWKAFLADAWKCDEWEVPGRLRKGERLNVTAVFRSRSKATTAPTTDELSRLVAVHAMTLKPKGGYAFFSARGLNPFTIRKANLGYTGRAYVIPIYGPDRELQTVRYRRDDDFDPNGPKYWGTAGRNDTYLYVPPLFRWFDLQACQADGIDRDQPGPSVLCEGELDALLLAQSGIRAVSLTNGAGSFRPEHVDWFGPKVVVAFDNDDAGRKEGARVVRLLRESGREAVPAQAFGDAKDVTDLRRADPALYDTFVACLRASGFAYL